MRKSVWTLLLLAFAGCDTAYRYFLFAPSQPEFTLVPDPELMSQYKDTLYSISRNGQSVVYDRKTFKVEVKYMPDFQLNNVEFPDESKDREFSANPFTYANWVDPRLGYTPNRFSVFKISIFNYTASKLNFDPENSFLVSDRGDLFPGYGREEKTSRNQSLETYFKRRKGASGVEDEIFERRMGLVRTSVLYLGRPIYSGDSREGLVVYDPLDESVQQVKLVFKDFIVGYDENNEPSDFITMQFFFKRAEVQKELLKPLIPVSDSTAERVETAPLRQVSFHQLRYRSQADEEGGSQDSWNMMRNALPSVARFLQDSLKIKADVKVAPPDSPELTGSDVVFLLAGPSEPIFADHEVNNLASYINQGGFLFIDNSGFSVKYQYSGYMESLLGNIAAKLDKQAKVMTLPADHEIFRSWRKLPSLPEGMDDRERMPDRRSELKGLFWKNRLVALVSTKGYSMIWDQQDMKNYPQYVIAANVIQYVLSGKKK